jgi:hypothetical protein
VQKIIFRISVVLCVIGLILSLGEIYRKTNHKDKVLAEMNALIEEVKNAPKATQAVDSDGIPIQSEADVQALTASFKMNCLAQVVNKWQVPTMCEPIVMSILKDPIDAKDLSFRPVRKWVLWGIFLALSPLYFWLVRHLWRQFTRKPTA